MTVSKVLLGLLLLGLIGCSRPELHCNSEFTPIATIQGAGEQSPLYGQAVITHGVITAKVYPDSPQAGWMLQSTDAGAVSASSQALFVAASPELELLQPGHVIRIRGTVEDIEQLTSLVDVSAFRVCDQVEPEPVIVQLPLAEHLSWEALEGMWLRFEQPLVINSTYQLGRYGELTLADKRLWTPTQIVEPGEAARAHAALQERRMLVLDDGLWQQNPDPLLYPPAGLSAEQGLRLGDIVTGVEGVLFQDQRGYRLVPTSQPDFQVTNPRPAAIVAKQAGELRVASFNVLNFFTGADQPEPFPTRRGAQHEEELRRQTAKLTSAILAMDADIVGLIELENNGYDEGSAIATLVTALNQQTERPYRMVTTAETPGGDAIKVGLIYRPDAVSESGQAATQTAAPFTRLHRPPVAQTFHDLQSGKDITISVNHFKAKGGCPRSDHPLYSEMRDQGDGQSCWNAARVEATKALHQWLQQHPTGIDTPYQILMGDLNAYRMEDPVRWLEQQGWHYLSAHDDQPSYSFVFRGKSGSLDHALASPALAALPMDVKHWPINADEPVLLEYSFGYKSEGMQEQLFAPHPYRSSDHDPVILTFSLQP
ncbi:ExeM/NucH family extracellular endonuclease [Alkalimonas collagenimarina]|uniref:ExeM/NucH family extracellular endonuclease n=1 Tax=Alkalimonas collagenimarina TaxID=400390 RepID=A0ABT9H3P7_9GAMM|nr:ExeM/NucH family extracellular endonuclease [Alkalimonas collagenimarina]MDP4537684.1 ExeM/NucH family extracellular endonuclease [Alkalimonas collagenimarina]